MKSSKQLTVTLAVLVGSLVVAGAAPAQANTTVVNVPLVLSAQAGIESCVGETVGVTDGSFHVVFSQTPTRWLFHRNVVSGDAVGNLTGDSYKVTGHIQEIEIAPPTSAYVYTYELTLNVNSTSSAGGFAAHAVEHVTITPQGELTSYIDVFDVTCR
jgi:hypothetical protein